MRFSSFHVSLYFNERMRTLITHYINYYYEILNKLSLKIFSCRNFKINSLIFTSYLYKKVVHRVWMLIIRTRSKNAITSGNRKSRLRRICCINRHVALLNTFSTEKREVHRNTRALNESKRKPHGVKTPRKYSVRVPARHRSTVSPS